MMALSQEEIEKRIADSYEMPNDVLKQMPRPLVSVRTSTYNHGPYIRQCIEGVLMQKTNFPFEFIIGEDFSSDETREIVFEYVERYPDVIRVITADYNVGSKANGRRCIRACRGKYMAICEGDDYWTDPLKLQKQVDFLEANPDYGLIHTDYSVCNSGKNTILKTKYIWPSGDILSLLLFGIYNIGTLTVLFRKDIYDRIPKFYTNQKFKMGDLPLWIELARVTKVKYLPENTATYRITDNSASHSNDIEKEIAFALSAYEIKRYYSAQFGMLRNAQRDNFEFTCGIVKLAYLRNNLIVSRKYYSELKNTPYKIPLKTKLFYLGTRFWIVHTLIDFLYKLPIR